MTELSWVSILPPVLAILLAIWSRQVYVSLFLGIFLGWTILAHWNPVAGIAGTLEGIIDVFKDGGNTRVIFFCGMVGALITLTQRSGGVDGFVGAISRRGWVKSRRSAQLMAGMVGVLVFVESSISCLIVGAIFRPIFDRMKISREKLAYICDSTSSPVNLLIPLNAWGAFIMGLLARENVGDPLGVFLSALPYNFYGIAALVMVFVLVSTGRDFGPMKRAEQRVRETGKVLADNAQPMVADEVVGTEAKPGIEPRASNMLVPVLTMIVMVPVGLVITGQGNLTAGSGSTSVFWAVLASIAAAGILYRVRGLLSLGEVTDLILRGIGGMVPLMLLMTFAFAIGDVTRELHTGIYVARLAALFLNPVVIPVIIFLLSCFIAFSTGTSWGTFAIMVPIALPVAGDMGISLPLVLAALLGGGLFGDHCSPISDTTLVASMASASDHIDHVRTQLPYALTAAAAAAVLYLAAGMM